MLSLLKGLSKGTPGQPQPTSHQGPRALKKGMSGMDVARCQNLLNRELSFSPPPLWVDGIFGAKTDRKVREFQMKKGLTVDGIVGPATRAALEGKAAGYGGGGGGAMGKGYGGGGSMGKGYGGRAGGGAQTGYTGGGGMGGGGGWK